jgi:membrane protease YdiL (CAAX protease family)
MATDISTTHVTPKAAVMRERTALPAFFLLACAISWLIQIPLAASARGALKPPISPYWHYAALCGPMLAAILVSASSEGLRGVRALLGHLTRRGVDPGWYLFAALGPFVALVTSAGIAYALFGQRLPDFDQFWRSMSIPGSGWLIVFGVFLLAGMGEEVGWRGFALPRLQKGRSALAATLILSVFWGLWHLPMFLYHPMFLSMSTGVVIGWAVTLAAGAIVLTWLYNSTRGSLAVVSLFHGALNVAFTSQAARGYTAGILGVMFLLGAVLIVAVAGPKHLSRHVQSAISRM